MMERKPCYDSKDGRLNKGPWKRDEDLRLTQFIRVHGEGFWSALAKKAGLKRSGKSCRFRWMNYLRPNLKHGKFSPDEEDLIIRLHKLLGNRWSLIAGRIPGRTDNEVKNYWNTRLNKKTHGKVCIRLKSIRPTETNIKEPPVGIITPASASQEGKRKKVIYCPVIEDLKKGSSSSNCPTKQEARSCNSDAGQPAAVSAEMGLWNPLQLNSNISPSWAYSNFLHEVSNSVFVPSKPISYNQENVHPLSCLFDTEYLYPDYIDHLMYSIPCSSLPFPEVGVHSDAFTVAPHMDESADFFNPFQNLY